MQLHATVSNMVSMRKLLLIAGLLAALPVSAGEFYCCPDPVTGRRICEDTVPAQCRGRGYKVLDSAGNLLRDVPPPLTPEQKAQQAQEAKLRKQQEEAAYIMERLDELATVLMDVYNGKEKLEAVETVASALHNNIRYKVGSLVTDGGQEAADHDHNSK